METCAKPLEDLTAREVGLIGEKLAQTYLESRGQTILERNWKCYAGEVDIILQDGDETAFLEVKTRIKQPEGEVIPELAITKQKRDKYLKLIKAYMAEHPDVENVRFDALGITLDNERIAHLHYITGITLDEQL